MHHGIRLPVKPGLAHRHAVLRVGHAQMRGRGVHVGPAVNPLPLQRLHTDESRRLEQTKRRCCSLGGDAGRGIKTIINTKRDTNQALITVLINI